MDDSYQQKIQRIMDRPVSRTEFIRSLGVLLLGLVGVKSFLNHFESLAPKPSKPKGYGVRPYGR
jgi:uncharacterized protein (DUF927 family)